MRILYSICGDGMGHAMRSAVVINKLKDKGHNVRIASSGNAFRYLSRRFKSRVIPIIGLSIVFRKNSVRPITTILKNIFQQAMFGSVNHAAFIAAALWHPDIVITDFEPWGVNYARLTRTPLLSLDNIHFLTRCIHPPEIIGIEQRAAELASTLVNMFIHNANHYLVLSFADAPIVKDHTSLHLPVLRDEILMAKQNAMTKNHILAYFNASTYRQSMFDAIKTTKIPFRVYGEPGITTEIQDDNIIHCPFSEDAFIRDISTARAVIGGAGFTLMSESIFLGKPMLAVPFKGQFEQSLNANYLTLLGYGERANFLDADTVNNFIKRLPHYTTELRNFYQKDNTELIDVLETKIMTAIKEGPIATTDLAVI